MAFSRETHYTLNRLYLLASCLISFILPLLQIGRLKTLNEPGFSAISVATSPVVYRTLRVTTLTPLKPDLSFWDYLPYVYLAGVLVFSMVLLLKLYRLLKLSNADSNLIEKQYKLVFLPDSNTAFSFFNYLFVGKQAPGFETIIRHELVHIRQKHSLDILLLEVFKIINWFNPFIYLLQNSLKTLHEYIADEITARQEQDVISYASFLVDNAYGLSGSSITHSFFNYNLLKKRIIMLNQQRSGKLARLKYLLAIPVCAGLLCASTLCFSKNYALFDLAPPKTGLIVKKNGQVTQGNRDSVFTPKYQLTKKGYKYREDGYLVNSKANFRVIIVDGKTGEIAFFRNSLSPAQIKMLRDKYGYSFPTMNIYPKLPPPPPMPPAPKAIIKRPPPPPPAPPVKAEVQAPVSSRTNVQETSKQVEQHSKTFELQATYHKTAPDKNLTGQLKPQPMIIVNGVKYDFKEKLKQGQIISWAASDSVRTTIAGTESAIKKWGDEANNGVIELFGKYTSMAIK